MARGKIDNPNVTFAASDADWVAMSNNTLNVSSAYLTGRLKIQGSYSLVRKLDEIFLNRFRLIHRGIEKLGFEQFAFLSACRFI
jgi:putative sterol carrier protein